MRVYAHAWEWVFYYFLHFVTCGWCVLNFCCSVEFVFAAAGASKTTRRFIESDVLFYRKWRVVLWKTTCCFVESEPSFLVTSSQCLVFYLFMKCQKEMPQKWILQHLLYLTNEVSCMGSKSYLRMPGYEWTAQGTTITSVAIHVLLGVMFS